LSAAAQSRIVLSSDFVIRSLIFAFNVILFGDLLPTGIFCRRKTRRLSPATASYWQIAQFANAVLSLHVLVA
jgi:hypothetical protein